MATDRAVRGMTWPRRFAREGVHPFDELEWSTARVEIRDSASGAVVFADDFEAPTSWGEQARTIVSSKYCYGRPGDPNRERSARDVIGRVAKTIAKWGFVQEYFATPRDAVAYEMDLIWLLVNQCVGFNSPVWFNVGHDLYPDRPRPPADNWAYRDGVVSRNTDIFKHPQVHACFIQPVEDSISGIMQLATSEALVFKYGSGTGTDLSAIRSTREELTGGGKPSGPVSFMRIFDSVAATIKSGGKSRRAAKMQTLRCDHPDIMEFIGAKWIEEEKARVLVDAGYAGDMGGEAYTTVAFQNCNMSVRNTDQFMKMADSPFGSALEFPLRAVTTGEPVGYVCPRDVLWETARCAWECGDPAVQFEDRFQEWHTTPNAGPINSTNPCARRGSRLLTPDGWKTVEDLADRDGVLIFDGLGFAPGRVWKTGHKPVVRVHLNSGEYIDLTSDHRIYASAGWIEAGKSMEATVPRIIPMIPNLGSSRIPKAITGASGRFYNVPSVDLMESLGFIQGDANIKDVALTLHYTPDKDAEFIESVVLPVLQDIAADKGEIEYRPSHAKDHSSWIFSRTKLTRWLVDIGFQPVTLPNRRLPDIVWGVKKTAQAAFLRGLFGANGNVLMDARVAVVLVSTCREMLREVQLILRSMGIVSAVRRHNKEQMVSWDNGDYTSRESYHLEITHQQDISLFARTIGFPQASQRDRLKIAVREGPAHRNDSASLKRAQAKVVAVEDLGISDDVYDFSVETTHAAMCDGIVIHNCGEYAHLDNSGCNLATLRLTAFASPDQFRVLRFQSAVEVVVIAQDIVIDPASYPTAAIAQGSRRYRQLGLNYADLGALLMGWGIPYDSDLGRDWCAAITSLMTATAYRASASLAARLGPFEGFEADRDGIGNVLRKHTKEHADRLITLMPPPDRNLHEVVAAGMAAWDALHASYGCVALRNSQVTLLAPTGTIAFMLGCSTLGIEPEIALVRYKALAGGGHMKIANGVVRRAVVALGGYSEAECREIEDHVARHDTIEPASEADGTVARSPLRDEHMAVFDCALPPRRGALGRSISADGHLKMMAAAQPFLSGAISKTINMPHDSTVEDIYNIYMKAWQLGLKSVTVYRDGCKGGQPVTTAPVVVQCDDQGDAMSSNGKARRDDQADPPGQPLLSREDVEAIVGEKVGNLPGFPPPDVPEGDPVPEGSRAATREEVVALAMQCAFVKVVTAAGLVGEGTPYPRLADIPPADVHPLADRVVARLVAGREGAAPEPATRPSGRRRLPDTRESITHKFEIRSGVGTFDFYITCGYYDDHTLGEVFLKSGAKMGSALGGLLDVIGTETSLLLQYGVPVDVLVRKFAHAAFEPSGMTGDPDIPFAKSPVDYAFRWIGLMHCAGPVVGQDAGPSVVARSPLRGGAGSMNLADVTFTPGGGELIPVRAEGVSPRPGRPSDGHTGDVCPSCHNPHLVREGNCWRCHSCFWVSGGCGG